MAGDIFGYSRSGKPQTVFSSESASLTFEKAGKGYMIQNWNVNYQQTVQEIFELGSSNLYWLKGQPQGQGTIQRIVGGTGSGTDLFSADAFDVCAGGAAMTINANAGACNGTVPDVNINMDGCVVTSVGFSSSVQDLMIQQNFGWRFAKLSIS